MFTKTYRYLYPSLAYENGQYFLTNLSRLFKCQWTKVIEDGRLKAMPETTSVILNSFLGDINHPPVQNGIFLLVRKRPEVENMLSLLSSFDFFVESYSPDEQHIMLVYEIRNKRAYNYFILSQYSKMYSKDFLNKYLYNPDQYHYPYEVMVHSPALEETLAENLGLHKNQLHEELDSVLDIQKEIYGFRQVFPVKIQKPVDYGH